MSVVSGMIPKSIALVIDKGENRTMKQSLDAPEPDAEKKLGFWARQKAWMDRQPVATFGNFILYGNGEFEALSGEYQGRYPVAGLEVALEDGTELSKRVTLTRFVATGLIALAIKKKKGGEKWLVIQAPNAEWLVEVPRKKQDEAVKFTQALRKAVRAAKLAE